jgi:eukaryotic-like serine/threonine-protein kinase
VTQPEQPSSVGRYRILDVLGSGSTAVVYRAHDPLIDRPVAVKVVRIDAGDAEEQAAAVARFRREVQAAGQCSHPGIVRVYDFIQHEDRFAIVMELVDGSSLYRHLRDPGMRAGLKLSAVVLEVLDALNYAHGRGIIHRDIKPANILLTVTGQVKIADFGVARFSDSNATQVGTILGTPSYMAPEQAMGDTVDSRADLFAVGAIFYEMLVGRPPFAGATITETVLRVCEAAPADMAPVSAAGGHAYAGVVQRALNKDKSRRFQTANAFAEALRLAVPGDIAGDEQATVVLSRGPRTWDPAFLQQTERQLARFAGPMARVAVVQAASAAATPDELYAALARGLDNAADRNQFLRAVGVGRVEPSIGGSIGASIGTRVPSKTVSARTILPQTLPPQTPPPQTSPPRTPPAATVSPEALAIPPEAAAAAEAALVVYTGPIARMLVRAAVAKAASGADFIERACAHVSKPDELAALRRRLRLEVEPKLPRLR